MTDYQKHLVLGCLLALIIAPWAGFYWSMGIVALVACFKEFYDAYQPENAWDWKDIIMTLEGGFIVSFLVLIVNGCMKGGL